MRENIEPSPVRRRITAGELSGVARGTVAQFLGVPYAAAPFGPHRFALPAPAVAWSGVRQATANGPTAPQRPGVLDGLVPVPNVAEADMLHLNLWMPTEPSTSGAPVLVWFHGGSLRQGANSEPLIDGRRLAAAGMVVVSANYRLGIEGFSVLADAPANLGLADQVAALQWVHDEITVFGGNPEQVTVGGQSAGGATVAALMTSPAAAGLLHRAVIQSGPLGARSIDQAGEVTRLIAGQLGVEATRQAFAAFSPEALLDAQEAVLSTAIPGVNDLGFDLAVDGSLLTESPRAALGRGVADAIPLVIGVTSEEHRLWMAPFGLLEFITDDMVQLVAAARHYPPSLLEAYRLSRPGTSPADLLGRLLSDETLRSPMVAMADQRAARGAPTYVYEFAWRSPAFDLGAAHCVDLPFVFDTLDTPVSPLLVGDDPPRALSTAMGQAWTRFIGGGDPGWPTWDATRAVKVFDGDQNPVAHDLHPDERAAMAAFTAVDHGADGG